MRRSAPRWVAAMLAAILSAALSAPAAAQDEALLRGGQALQSGDTIAATAAFEEAIAADSGNVAAWLGLSAAHEIATEWRQALRAARQAVVLAPDVAETHLSLARVLARTGPLEDALAAFATTRRLGSEIEAAYLLPALLLRDAGRSEEAMELLEQGMETTGDPAMAEQLAFLALGAGDSTRALAVVEGALGEGSERGDLLLAKALALAAMPDRRAEADPWFARALDAGVAQEGRARLEWGRLLSDQGNWVEAVEQLEKVTTLMPGAAEAYFRLGAALRQVGDLDAAKQALAQYQSLNAAEVAAERQVREIGTALNEAQELAGQNRLEEALVRLGEVSGGESDPRVLVLRGKVLFSLRRVDEALVAVSLAGSLAPLDAEPAYLEGLFSFAAERFERAARAIERVLMLAPDLGEAWALMGSTQARLQRASEAADSFERALELGFDSAAMRLEYAGVLSDLGRSEESRLQLEARERLTGG